MKLLILLCLATSALGCGIHLPKTNASRATRSIIGGANVTTANKWPWQVLMTIVSTSGQSAICGGTIIGAQWVLTAGHCVKQTNVSATQVFAGATLQTDFKEEYTRGVIEGIVHPEFYADIQANDIALLKLDAPIVFDDVASPICLPNPSQSIHDDGRAVITGFGKIDVEINGTILAFNQTNPQLREAIVPIVNPEVCRELWSHDTSSGLPKEKRLEVWNIRHILCASSLARGPHQGDSGGPLMMKASNGRWFQLGITSFGHCDSERCDQPTDGIRGDLFPKIFTDVRKYCGWIEETTGGEVTCHGQEVMLEDAGITV